MTDYNNHDHPVQQASTMIRSRLKFFTIVAGLAIVVSLAAAYKVGGDSSGAGSSTQPDELFAFYAGNLRASLFAGFLTLGSFLVAVNTFVIVNLKKEVYDQVAYIERASNVRKTNPKASFYGPLRRLSALILWTIICALVTAVMQLTVGIIFRNRIGAIACLAAAAITMILLFVSLFNIRLNLKDWFTFWEEQECIKEQARKDAQQSKI